MVAIPLPKTLNQASSGYQSLEQVVNCYVEPTPDAPSPFILRSVPGLKAFSTVGVGPHRGSIIVSGRAFVVSGNELYTVISSGASTLVGSVPAFGRVKFVTNGRDVAFLVGPDAFWSDGEAIYALPIGGFVDIAYQDGFAIFSRQGQEIYSTNTDDFSTIPAENVTQADALPDENVAVVSDQRQIWAMKERTTEIYSNVGGQFFPFERTQFLEVGCAAASTVAKGRDTIFWVGRDADGDVRVFKAVGFGPERVSTPHVERILAAQTSLIDAFAFTYAQGDREFYVLSLSNVCVALDVQTGLWHRRRSQGLQRWRATSHVVLGGKHVLGDYLSGQMYELDPKTFTENGAALIREIWFPPLAANGQAFCVNEFHVQLEQGMGLSSGQGSEPMAILRWTDDGGRSFSNDIEAPTGKIGEYLTETRWTRLGRSPRTRTFVLIVSEPIDVRVHGAFAEIEVLQ